MLKPVIVIRTKGDTYDSVDEVEWKGIPEFFMEISAVAQKGLTKLVKEIAHRLNAD